MIIKRNYNRPRSGTVIVGRQKRKNIVCPSCGEGRRLWRKEKIAREVPHIQILDTPVIIRWEGYKYHCQDCGRYFREQFPGLLKRRRFTEVYRKEVFNLHKAGVSQVELSRLKGIGTATVERWFKQLLERKNREYNSYSYPSHIGIDEQRFTRKVGFCTTITDLSGHKVLDIYKGRSSQAIQAALKKIPGRKNVKMVAMDLSETYRKIVKDVFPQAIRVADRFHVIRLINQHFLSTWQHFDPENRKNRGLLSLMRRHEWHLDRSQAQALDRYLSTMPSLKSIYDFKQDLVRLLLKNRQTVRQCKQLIPQLIYMIQQLQKEQLSPLVTLGNTLANWQGEIAAMWRFTKSNGITEGFHRKMKLIQRRAYGFKNFENYRLRVRVLCGSMNLNSILT